MVTKHPIKRNKMSVLDECVRTTVPKPRSKLLRRERDTNSHSAPVKIFSKEVLKSKKWK